MNESICMIDKVDGLYQVNRQNDHERYKDIR